VPGGGHWGGGLFIGARDHARFGLLIGRQGDWGGRQILSRDWVRRMLTPSPTLTNYGYLWWLAARPGVPAKSFSALGAGSNVIWVDPSRTSSRCCAGSTAPRPMASSTGWWRRGA
jgi:CubicO group peptidase (beta-lactamase class C family)